MAMPSQKTELSFILHMESENEEIRKIFSHTPWGEEWEEVLCGSIDTVNKRYDITINASSYDDKFKYPLNLRLGIWCKNVEQLEQLKMIDSNVWIIFSPTILAVLDQNRLTRKTLSARSKIRKGEVIRREHLVENIGGDGVSAELVNGFVGQIAAYDIKEGETIDFGKIL